ncbi:hypothetical protein QTO34_008576 [Cnephaeus nilssonii]|uniref:Uncharacterized protein n=1 Tax=Cnephaeus nilssonii TaxID=3371016 RepID=A0AA40IBP3_CNENI|nr:hypothetical protein QTO34_008576 [Eptesicus nilssonii]
MLPALVLDPVMESHRIRVNKEELERTSALLGSRLKELEREAHFVAGEQFLVTSSDQLREILFGKLKLQLLSPKGDASQDGAAGPPVHLRSRAMMRNDHQGADVLTSSFDKH